MENKFLTEEIIAATVLLVDDEADFAKAYLPLWEKRSGLKFAYAQDARTAIEIVKHGQIKVVVLDYIMPTSGFDLRRTLLNIDPKLKTILLSGELADRFRDAHRQGFDHIMVKDKSDLDLLPQTVISLVLQYENEMKTKGAVSDCSFEIEKQTAFFKPRFKIRYSVLDYSIIDEEKVMGNWHTNVFIQEGQELTSEAEFNIEHEFQFTRDFKIENENGLNISKEGLFEFKSYLSLKLGSSLEEKYTERVKEVFRRTNTYSLRSNSDNVVSRSYEYAKMARVLKIYVKKECTCCEETTIVPITAYCPIPVIKYRMVEHYRDNSKKIIDLGEVR